VPVLADELQASLCEARDKGRLTDFRLTEAVHRKGVNMRYIGLVRRHMSDLDSRTLLLVEMCARVVKNKICKLLRRRVRQLRVPLEEPYRQLVRPPARLFDRSTD
jgi:hypothetical protein